MQLLSVKSQIGDWAGEAVEDQFLKALNPTLRGSGCVEVWTDTPVGSSVKGQPREENSWDLGFRKFPLGTNPIATPKL